MPHNMLNVTEYLNQHLPMHTGIYTFMITVEPPIKDPPNKGQPPNNGHIAWHQTYGCSVI